MTDSYYKIKILICDDHELVREGLQVIVRKLSDIEIVGEAKNGEELVDLTEVLQPDVILTDVKMPKLDGIQAAIRIKEQFPHIGIVALSSFDEEDLIVEMMNAGANGYLLKNASKQELNDAIKAAYRNETYYCKHTNWKLIQLNQGSFVSSKSKVARIFKAKELEVIELICEGLSSKQIASALKLSPRTVERYRDSIMEKMDVKNAAGLVMYAVRNGIYKEKIRK